MADGTLPNFARLAREGHYQVLPTTNPAQSPVAWSSFATGLNPGEHGIFDFLRRNTETYAPDYAISFTEPPDTVIRVRVSGAAGRGGDVQSPCRHAILDQRRTRG